MQLLQIGTRYNILRQAALTAGALCLATTVYGQGPLAAKVNVTPVAVYTGGSPLPKPDRILVYDFQVDSGEVQVDKMQALRPRHLITGDRKPDAVAGSAVSKYSKELIKALEKTGIPVEHAVAGGDPAGKAMVVQGSFTSLKEGNKTERDTIGMGAGGADVETRVDVHLNTPAGLVLLSQFNTDTKPAPNLGSAVPIAAGLNPVTAVARSTVGDRRKTVNAYASKSADATAKEIFKSMAAQGWIKTNAKGEVSE